jgi:hypothetical protein
MSINHICTYVQDCPMPTDTKGSENFVIFRKTKRSAGASEGLQQEVVRKDD